MDESAGAGVCVYIRLHPHRQAAPSDEVVGRSCEKCGNEEHSTGGVKEAVGATILSDAPCLVLPTVVEMRGSGSKTLFHSGCVDSNALANTFADRVWNEVQKSGTFWFLHCASPTECVNVRGHGTQFGCFTPVAELVLCRVVERTLQVVSSPLTVTLIQWTEEGVSFCESATNNYTGRRSNESAGKFTDSDTIMKFVRNNFGQEADTATHFWFGLVSLTFIDPFSERTREIVVASVSGFFDGFSASTSVSLVAVRSLFANMTFMRPTLTQKTENEDVLGVFSYLQLFAADLLPPEVVRFFSARLFCCLGANDKNKKEEVALSGSVTPVSLQVVCVALDVDERHFSVGKNSQLVDVATSTSFVRYLTFWSPLGTLVVDDVEGCAIVTHNSNKDNNAIEKDEPGSEHVIRKMIEEAKWHLFFLLTDSVTRSQLDEELFRNLERTNERTVASGRLLLALEHTHSVTLWARQKGMQRQIRRLLESKLQNNFAVKKILEFFTAENEALLWCQRLEWRYYTLLGKVLCKHHKETLHIADMNKRCMTREIGVRNTTDQVTNYNEEEKEKEVKEQMSLSLPGRRCVNIVDFSKLVIGGTPLQLMSSFYLIYRLSEAEATRRILIKLAAVQSFQEILLALVQMLQLGIVPQNSLPVFDSEAFTFPKLSCRFAENIEVMLILPLVKCLQEKTELFTDCTNCLLRQYKEAASFASLNTIKTMAQGTFTASKITTAEVGSNTDTEDPHIFPNDETLHSTASAEEILFSITTANATIERQDPGQLQPQPKTTEPETPLKLKECETVIGNSEALRTEGQQDGQLLLSLYRFSGVNARTSVRNLFYRKLLLSGCKQRVLQNMQDSASTVPVLSFAEILKEKENWRGTEELDDYRMLMAYSVYVVGELGCGKSTIIDSLLQSSAKSASSFSFNSTVELHTMKMKRTPTFVEVSLPCAVLPFGDHAATAISDWKKWTDTSAEEPASICRLGVNFIEAPSPLLLPASVGSVKLPIRGAAYYIVYRLLDDLETVQRTIRQNVRTLQSALMMPTSDGLWGVDYDESDAENFFSESAFFPVVLFGTHADLMSDLSAFDQETVVRKRLGLLGQWFESQNWQQKREDGLSGHLPQPLLLNFCFASSRSCLIASGQPGDTTTFQVLLHRTLRFLHRVAPLSPSHILARWLPRRFIVSLEAQCRKTECAGGVAGSTCSFIADDGTLEGFWRLQHCRNVASCVDKSDAVKGVGQLNDEALEKSEELQSKEALSSAPSQTLMEWWNFGLERFVVFFTALQRLRQFASCCFDKQFFDSAVLCNLGFVHIDDQGEIVADHGKEKLMRERNIFLASIFKECHLRGVLVFLSFFLPREIAVQPVSCASAEPETSFSEPRIVLVGLEWVENIWAQTLAPQMVLHHVLALHNNSDDDTPSSCVAVIFEHCKEQLGIEFSSSYFAEVWPQLFTPFVGDGAGPLRVNAVDTCKYFYDYFMNGSVSLALLQLLWRPPYDILATQKVTAVMTLLASGLAHFNDGEEKNVENGNGKDMLARLRVPCAVLSAETFFKGILKNESF